MCLHKTSMVFSLPDITRSSPINLYFDIILILCLADLTLVYGYCYNDINPVLWLCRTSGSKPKTVGKIQWNTCPFGFTTHCYFPQTVLVKKIALLKGNKRNKSLQIILLKLFYKNYLVPLRSLDIFIFLAILII